MLKQRVITALILAAAFVGLLLFGPWYLFLIFAGAMLCVAAWEWSRLAGWVSPAARGGYTAISIALGVVLGWWLLQPATGAAAQTLLLIACGWWAVALLWIQSYPASALLWQHPLMRSLMGWLVLLPAWAGLVLLRRQPGGEYLILIVVLLVACADIGAYFCGRKFGKRKLAPRVSPGKSWEGVLGGLVTALMAGLIINGVWGHTAWSVVAAVVIPTALVSVLGDLLESMVKRHAGVKDSGSILPGHGGVLDRVDGLTAAIPVFTLAVLLSGWQF